MTEGENGISTAHFADACMRLGMLLRFTAELRPLQPAWTIQGPARCVQHFGSVDIFLEAIDDARNGEVLVVDNQGRGDEGCIGDLIVAEALHAGIAGIVVWGRHRDSKELRRIGLPVFSLGSCALGPSRLDERSSEAFGTALVDAHRAVNGDWIVADEDGLLIFSAAEFPRVRLTAGQIHAIEHQQAVEIARGNSLRNQLRLQDYKRAREKDPTISFRDHLAKIGGAVEV